MTLNIEFPEQLNAELEVIPKTGHYTSTSEFLKDAIKTILAARKDLRVSIAIELYKKDYSLGRVAEIADLDYEAMKEILVKSGLRYEGAPRRLRSWRTVQECCVNSG